MICRLKKTSGADSLEGSTTSADIPSRSVCWPSAAAAITPAARLKTRAVAASRLLMKKRSTNRALPLRGKLTGKSIDSGSGDCCKEPVRERLTRDQEQRGRAFGHRQADAADEHLVDAGVRENVGEGANPVTGGDAEEG